MRLRHLFSCVVERDEFIALLYSARNCRVSTVGAISPPWARTLSWNGNKNEVGKDVELLTILDDQAYTDGENKDVQLAIRMLGCARRNVFKLTHVYIGRGFERDYVTTRRDDETTRRQGDDEARRR